MLSINTHFMLSTDVQLHANLSFNYKKQSNRCEDKYFTDLIRNHPFKSLLCVETMISNQYQAKPYKG